MPSSDSADILVIAFDDANVDAAAALLLPATLASASDRFDLARDDEHIKAHVDAVQHITAITTKTNGTGNRRRLEGRRRAFQQASAVAASQSAANQRSSRVLGSASGAQASATNRTPKPTSRTLTTCQVKRTMPSVIEGEPNGVLGRCPFVRLGRTQRRPTVIWPRARTKQPSPAIANSTFILSLLLA
jgi:hypothetical protein